MMIRTATSDVLPLGAIAAFASGIFALGVVAGELPASAPAPAAAADAPGSVSDLLHHAQSAAAADRFEQLFVAIKGVPPTGKVVEPEKSPAPAAPAAPAVPVTSAAPAVSAAPAAPVASAARVVPAARPAPAVAEVKAATQPSAAASGLPKKSLPQLSTVKLPGKLQGHAPRPDAETADVAQ